MKCAILNDYQKIALTIADWSSLRDRIQITVFTEAFEDEDRVFDALKDFEILVLMRERTPLPRSLIARLQKLRLIVTTGKWNPSVDLEAALERGITVCHTRSVVYPTAEMTWGLILALARHIPVEDDNLRANGAWQRSIGIDLHGKTLGLVGLGTVGRQVAHIGQAFGMNVIAWSQNLTAEACRQFGVSHASKQELLRTADVLSIHVQLSKRTIGLIGAAELASMKSGALLINTSRGFVVDQAALVAALTQGTIAGAALDVYETEPLPPDDPLRTLPNTVLTPHLGYVTEDTYRLMYSDVVENIAGWLDGSPIRLLSQKQQLDRSK
jgi:phosphoglycerate dehydrogenase-like enzyme